MKVPKLVLIGLLFSAALFAGYEINEALHAESAAATVAAAPTAVLSPIAPEQAEPIVINLTLAGAGGSPAPASVVNLTLNGQTPTPVTVSGGGQPVAAASLEPVRVSQESGATPASAVDARSTGAAPTARAYQSPAATGNVVYASPTRPAVQNVVTVEAPDNRTNMAVNTGDRGNTGQDFSITAIGNNIVIAYGNSVAYAGDHGALTANTGNAASSATIALDVADSTVATGTSVSAPTTTGDAVGQSPLQPGSSIDGGLNPTQSVAGRGVAISGYEDHSLDVAGRDHVVTYDDSNVFIARNGQINANTGDTDSAGLNVVDATGSVVQSGNQNEDAGGDDEDEEEGDSESEAPESPIEVPDAASGVEASGDTDTEEAGSVTAAPTSTPAAIATPRANAGVSGEEDGDAGTTAAGDEALVIGGDGYDDLSVDVTGVGHVVSYDDSNVVIGGEGRVNAQIGDSDTSGAVVMGVTNSIIQAGNSS